MDWGRVDERLIRRGELLLSFDFVDGYDGELERMNFGKRGRPFSIADTYVRFLVVVRFLFQMGLRQVEGFSRALSKLVPRLPSIDYSWFRRRMLRLDLTPYQSLKSYYGSIAIAVDASGVSVHKAGGWVERLYGKKKRYVKIHFAVDVKTKEPWRLRRMTSMIQRLYQAWLRRHLSIGS